MRKRTTKGFSLVELVVVIVIIGIIAAMAIPRLSRGSAGAVDANVAGNLAIIRNAIHTYAAEHNGLLPSASIINELTMYSDLSGGTSATKDATHYFGPYLVSWPSCAGGDQTDPDALATSATSPLAPSIVADTGGWIYNATTGEFCANTNVTDTAGKGFNLY